MKNRITIVLAIGNHDESSRGAADIVSFALNLQIDERTCIMYDNFEIFLGRM